MSSGRRKANPRPRWLVVVARDQDEVHHKLSAALSDDCLVRVIFDRRTDPGRNPEWVSRSLRECGFAVVPLSRARWSKPWRACGPLDTRHLVWKPGQDRREKGRKSRATKLRARSARERFHRWFMLSLVVSNWGRALRPLQDWNSLP